jgi:N-acetylglutamate synthase-like GNAT family acetyltransferase
MTDVDREKMLRDRAANRGCKLVKSRRRKAGTGDYGRYGLKDAGSDREVFGFGSDGLTASPEEIEAFLRKGAVSDWKSSLAAAASAANDEGTPVPRRRAAKEEPEGKPKPAAKKPKLRVVEKEEAPPPSPPAPPPPPPAPPPRAILKIREARPADAEGLAALMDGADAKGLAARLSSLRRAGEPPLVADEGGKIIGAAAFHAIPLLQEEAPLGRISFLVVAPSHRRRGIGRALVEEAEARLVDLACARIEALAEIELGAAPDFFRRLGWERAAYRYARNLS